MSDRAINLVFYCFPKIGAVGDFREVARRVERAAPHIHAHVVRTDRSLSLVTSWPRIAFRPTVTVEMNPVSWFPPLRGRRLRHLHGRGKLHEFAALDAAGCPVPRWAAITPDTRLDPAEWGPYVVVKPSRGRRGAYVLVTRTSRVRYRPPESFPDGHPGRCGPMIAQRFIYTGRWPTSYRVLTYFGRPVFAVVYHGAETHAPLAGATGFGDGGGGRNIVASAKGARIELSAEPDVLALAERTHRAAFPEIPSLGHDIMRDAATGRLYVAEVNPGGNSWLLTNSSGLQIQAEFNLDFYAQFGALDIIADASIGLAHLAI